MIITIKQYAERNGLNYDNVRHKCQRGSFKTAQKIGRDWLIDSEEPNIDRRTRECRREKRGEEAT